MAVSSLGESFPAPGMLRSITNLGMAVFLNQEMNAIGARWLMVEYA